jgi:hypothetical protein
MRRALPMLTTAALVVGACSGGNDDTADSTVVSPDTVATTSTVSVPATEAPTTITETTTSEAPTTTIDEAAVLAEAEAAYLEAFEVSKEILRNPEDPNNDELIRQHFTGPNLEATLEALRLAIDGGFVARINEEYPTFATVVEPAEFVDGDTSVARMTVCEFNSDRLFKIGDAPGGGDSLFRDDPVSLLIVTSVELVDGTWKSSSGRTAEEIKDEVERCSDVTL